MLAPTAAAAIAASLLAAAWCAVLALRDALPGRRTVAGLALVELVLVAQLVVALVVALGGAGAAEPVVFAAYGVVSVVALPAGAAWALGERTRSGTVVLLVACLVVPVLVVRMQQTWAGPGG